MTNGSKRALGGASMTGIWAALALLFLLTSAGCSEVRKCTEGEPGCIDQPPDDGECSAGLVLRGGRCVEPEGGGGSCNCANDELCAPDGKTCLAYCEQDEEPEAVTPPPSCKPVPTASNPNPPPFDFMKLCTNTCLQNCLRAETFCPGHKCNPDDCTSMAARLLCVADCPGMDVACMENRCTAISKNACADFRCPAASPRSCEGVTCRDSCAGNNNDGFCDDGDPYSANYAFCPYGTDCTDCGPRRGSKPPGIPLGDPCPGGQDVSCEGYDDDFTKTEAWCLRFDTSLPYRCVPDCTEEDGPGACDDGYECKAVLNSNDEPYTDAVNGTAGYACIPLICE